MWRETLTYRRHPDKGRERSLTAWEHRLPKAQRAEGGQEAQKRHGQEGKEKVCTREQPYRVFRGTQPETHKDRGKASLAIIVGCVEMSGWRPRDSGLWKAGWGVWIWPWGRARLQKMTRKESVVCWRSIWGRWDCCVFFESRIGPQAVTSSKHGSAGPDSLC